MVISHHGHQHHIHQISDQDWKGTTAWGSIAHQRHRLWPLKTNLYQLNIGWTSWRRNILLTAATKIHLPTFSEVGFRSWRRTFGIVRVKPWFDCKNRWTSQMGIEHLLLYLQNMLLFCCRIELPYEHWWATTLRESVHHTWHVILLSDSSMLANLVFLVEVGSCTPLILWAHWRWGTLGRAYHWPTSCIGHVQLTGATMDANRDWEGLLEIWRFQTLSHCSLVVSRTGSENSWNESPVRLIIIAGWF